jgi:hypothetical protein
VGVGEASNTYLYNITYSLFKIATNLGKLELTSVMQLGGNNKRLLYAYRLHKDIAELFSHNFDCSSSSLKVIQQHRTVDFVSNQYHSRNGNGIISQGLSDTGTYSSSSSESLAFNDRGFITLQIKIFEGRHLPQLLHVVIIDLT